MSGVTGGHRPPLQFELGHYRGTVTRDEKVERASRLSRERVSASGFCPAGSADLGRRDACPTFMGSWRSAGFHARRPAPRCQFTPPERNLTGGRSGKRWRCSVANPVPVSAPQPEPRNQRGFERSRPV